MYAILKEIKKRDSDLMQELFRDQKMDERTLGI